MTSMVHVYDRDIADDYPKPVDGSWEFVGLIRLAMEMLSREGAGLFYCERDIERAELIVCFDTVLGACTEVQ